jgi:CRISPR type III-B/RAMP module RAMP protein Cmr1
VKPHNYHLEFITPCFCAGANQAVAEFRPTSIKGKLRWWFRVVGGTSEEEAEIFGSIHGGGHASSLIVRVQQHGLVQKWQPIELSRESNTSYVLYFAERSAERARWNSAGALPIGSNFNLQLLWRRPVSQSAEVCLDLALNCFLMLGSLGLRATRGLGTFVCAEVPFSQAGFADLVARVKHRSPQFIANMGVFSGRQIQILDALGAQLRGLRKGYSAGRPGQSNPTPLGSSSHPRQTSAVYLRPVRESSDQYRLVIFEAPAEKVLGLESRRGAPRLGNGVPAPEQPPQRDSRRR